MFLRYIIYALLYIQAITAATLEEPPYGTNDNKALYVIAEWGPFLVEGKYTHLRWLYFSAPWEYNKNAEKFVGCQNSSTAAATESLWIKPNLSEDFWPTGEHEMWWPEGDHKMVLDGKNCTYTGEAYTVGALECEGRYIGCYEARSLSYECHRGRPGHDFFTSWLPEIEYLRPYRQPVFVCLWAEDEWAEDEWAEDE